MLSLSQLYCVLGGRERDRLLLVPEGRHQSSHHSALEHPFQNGTFIAGKSSWKDLRRHGVKTLPFTSWFLAHAITGNHTEEGGRGESLRREAGYDCST